MFDSSIASTALYKAFMERIVSNLPPQRFVPLQSAPIWNGCGRPTAIHDCVLVKHRGRQVITAIRTLDYQLRLFSWRVDANGTARCTGSTDSQLENVAQVTLVRARKYISGSRTFSGAIHLQCWDVSNTGALYSSGPAVKMAVRYTWLQLLALAADRILTIGLTTAGTWELTTWSIDEHETLYQLAQSTQPATTGALAATCLTPLAQNHAEAAESEPLTFLTVAHRGLQQIRWTRWRCLANGQLEIMDEVTLPFTQIVALGLTVVDGTPVTLLHSANGRLQAMHGIPTGASDANQELSDKATAEDISTSQCTLLAENVRLFSLTHDAEQLTVAYITTRSSSAPEIRSPHGVGVAAFPEVSTVQMHRWHSAEQRWTNEGHGTIPIAAATELVLCEQPLDGNAPYLTAIGTATGILHLVSWSDTVQNQFN